MQLRLGFDGCDCLGDRLGGRVRSRMTRRTTDQVLGLKFSARLYGRYMAKIPAELLTTIFSLKQQLAEQFDRELFQQTL
ncbi:MAG: hypothetical protein QNJ54_07000 [Prochloraceae cyanobacterium]|nr:hypothetical protein [Prochloraceae cyanobacterium]